MDLVDSTTSIRFKRTPIPEDDMAGSDEDSDQELLALRSSTLSALSSFLDEQAAARDALVSLEIKSQVDFQTNEGERLVEKGPPVVQPPDLSVDKFKGTFRENWQLSQFWYSQDTAQRLAQAIKKSCPVGARVAFVCCPTGYVAFKESDPPTQEILLLEYDTRFAVVAGAGFVRYNLEEPTSFPGCEDLRNSVDTVVIDPPFHSEVSQIKISSTVAHILRPGGQLVILTGLTLGPILDKIYPSPPLPRLRRRDILIEHDGMGRLETPYGCWVGGGPDGQDDGGFGEILQDKWESR